MSARESWTSIDSMPSTIVSFQLKVKLPTPVALATQALTLTNAWP
jgi:hypothetical protein